MQSSDLLAQLQDVEQRFAAARNYEAAQAASEAAQAIGALRAKLKNLAHEEASCAASRDYAGAASAASAAKKAADDLQVEEARVCKQFDLVTGAAPVPPMATPVPPTATPAPPMATPVGPVATPVPVSCGAPVQQPVAMPVAAPVQVPHAVPVQPGAVGTGGWLAGLCECDCCSFMCCASLFFPFFPLGQLRQRVLGRSCKGFVFIIVFLYAVYSCLLSVGENLAPGDSNFEGCYDYEPYEYDCQYDDYGRCDFDYPWACYDSNFNPAVAPLVSIAGACSFVASLLMLLTACKIRAKLRRDHNIVGSCCGDFCTTLWCMPCSLFQMLRQVGVKVHTYEFCSKTGTGRGHNNELAAPIVVVDNHP